MNTHDIETRISNMIDHLATRWEDEDTSLLRNIFPLLAEGKRVAVEQIADSVLGDPLEIKQKLEESRADLDNHGRVTELFGVMFEPTSHKIEIDGVSLYTCCALVANTVPYLTGKPVTIESSDPVNNQVVQMNVSPDGSFSIEPETAVGCLVETSQEGMMGDVGSHFCSHIHLFTSFESAEKFVKEEQRRYVVDLKDFPGTARRLVERIWG